MKKPVLLLSAALLLLTVMNPSKGSALNLAAGLYTWYAWWDFPEDTYETVETDPNIIYGPIVSLTINEHVNLTTVFLYGNFSADGKNNSEGILKGNPAMFTYDIERYDSDTALNLRLNNYLKLYFGLKYTYYTYELNATSESYTIDFNHSALGPGAGVALTLPVGGNLYLIGTAGGFYLRGHEGYSNSDGKENEFDIAEYGVNTGVSMAYYIEAASTTVSLGGRYQRMKIKYDDGFSNTSQFYGITFSAIYSFNL